LKAVIGLLCVLQADGCPRDGCEGKEVNNDVKAKFGVQTDRKIYMKKCKLPRFLGKCLMEEWC
jgi:hypothetical protein